MRNDFAIIEDKLNSFIRKFYSNKLLLGVLFFVVFAVVAFTISFFAESYLYLSPLVKTFLFYSFLFILLSDLVFFVIFPLLKIFKILPVISYEEASHIISSHFPESKDTLLNLIQLNYQHSDTQNSELLLAAVNQKAGLMTPLNFSSAINFKTTFKYLAVSLGMIFIISLFATFNYDRFKRGAHQFMNYSSVYEPENPYSFDLLNTSMTIGRGEDFTVLTSVTGPSLPNDVFINFSGNNYRMNVDSSGFYSYTLRNVADDIYFSFDYLGYHTGDFVLKVFDKPALNSFRVSVVPPAYTKLEAADFDNTGDLSVPRGSLVSWIFSLQNANSLLFYTDSLLTDSVNISSGDVAIKKTALKDFVYNYRLIGDNSSNLTFSPYTLTVVPDVYPTIETRANADSTSLNAMFFSGHITDDYGFHSLNFVYYEQSNPKDVFTQTIDINNESINQDFFFYFDFAKFKSTVDYYFEVKDNDAISGFKSTKTTISSYNLLTSEQKDQRLSDMNSSIYDKVNESKSLLNEISKDLEDFQKSVSGNNNLSDYEKQLKIDNLVEKQTKLEDLLKQISDENLKKDLFQNQTNEQNQELIDKQTQMQELWNQLLNDDVRKLLDQINKLKDQISERNFRDKIDDLKFDFNQINEQLDRNNQLLKYFNTEQKLNDLTQELNKLSEEYKDFSRETFNKNSKSDKKSDNNTDKKSDNSEADSDNNDVSDFKDKFDNLKEKYDELMKQNSELDELKLNIDSLFEDFKQISDELDKQSKDFDQLSDKKSDKNSDYNVDNKTNNSDNKNQYTDNKSQNRDNKNLNNTGNDNLNPQNYPQSKENNTQSNENNSNSNENNSQSNENNSQSNENKQQQRQNLQQQMQKTAEKIEELAQQMNGQQQGAQQKKNSENLNDVRQILDNLVSLSFAQEDLNNYTNNGQTNALHYQELQRKQLSIRNDFALVRDSIYALAKREPKLGHAVYSKIDDINSSITQSLSFITENNKSRSSISQRNILTNFNDLALIFSEIEQDMQKQMQQGGSNSQDANEPVESRNKKRAQQRQQQFQKAKSGQQNLIQSLQIMIQQMQNGQKPSSQQMAESLRMQELLQQYIQQLQNTQNPSNQQSKNALQQINQMMEQNKNDIINRNITNNLINRQNQILQKLLDAENAEKNQEFDEKRESKQGKDFENTTNQPNFPFKNQQDTKEFIFRNYLNIDLFYLDKYNQYIQKIK